MAYQLEFETRARRELLDLPKDVERRFIPVFDDLARQPRPPGAKKLIGVNGYRVRKGDYRIIYTVDDHKRVVRVYRVGHRRDVYRR